MTTDAQEQDMTDTTASFTPEPTANIPTQQSAPQGSMQITWDDLSDDRVVSRVAEMQAARQVPLVQSVGAPTEETPTGLVGLRRGSVVTMVIAGIVGAFATWGLVELLLK